MSVGKKSKRQVEQVRQDVYERDGHLCLAGPVGCSGPITIQHARGKGMGGSALFDAPEWLRTLCWGHNVAQTADADFAQLCMLRGWAVPRNGVVDPHSIAVRYPDGHDYQLIGIGRVVLSRLEAAELLGLAWWIPRARIDVEGWVRG